MMYRLPYSYEMLRFDIDAFQQIDEAQQVQLLLAQVEDVTLLFPVNLPETLLGDPSLDHLEVWLQKTKQNEEQRHTLLLDWLKGGACSRFRTAAIHALGEIERATYLEDTQKVLYSKLVQVKKKRIDSGTWGHWQ